MTVAFKHLERRFAASAATMGSFLIQPLANFRVIENVGPGIRDEQEGSVTLHMTDASFAGCSEEATSLENAFAGLKIGPGTVRFVNSSVRRSVGDVYVLCMTSLRERSPEVYPVYDTTIEISSVEGLAEALRKAHSNRLGNWDARTVRYEPRTFELGQPIPRDTDPFIKDAKPEFIRQKEVRICWKARDECSKTLIAFAHAATAFVKILAPG